MASGEFTIVLMGQQDWICGGNQKHCGNIFLDKTMDFWDYHRNCGIIIAIISWTSPDMVNNYVLIVINNKQQGWSSPFIALDWFWLVVGSATPGFSAPSQGIMFNAFCCTFLTLSDSLEGSPGSKILPTVIYLWGCKGCYQRLCRVRHLGGRQRRQVSEFDEACTGGPPTSYGSLMVN